MTFSLRIVVLSLFLCAGNAVAAANAKNNEATTWDKYVISEPIEPSGENMSADEINRTFIGKVVTINDSTVNIDKLCNYQYSKEVLTPIEHWHSAKTVDVYRNILEKYNVRPLSKLSLITPTDPTEQCPYPFSYFMKINDNLVFSMNNRLVIYSLDSETVRDECKHKEQSAEEVYENGDMNICKYKHSSILSAYEKYRKSLGDDAEKLEAKLEVGKNRLDKCNDGCVDISYKWKGEGDLIVTQDFDGGETVVSFKKEGDDVLVIIRSIPD